VVYAAVGVPALDAVLQLPELRPPLDVENRALMTMDRGVHPDLIEEETAAQEAAQEAPETPAPSGRRGGRTRAAERAQPAPDAPADVSPAEQRSPTEPVAEEPTLPDWLRDAKDPKEALRSIIKNVPYDELEKDEVFSGLIGRVTDRRLRQQERDAAERAKRDAAANNDLYKLGELTQREIQERDAAQHATRATGEFMDGVVLFQQSLDDSLQKKVAGRTFGEGKGQAAGVAEYLQFLHDESVKLGVEKEIQRRESALRKSVLTEVNGDEPVPEREGGTPGRVREVTDEQIEAMTQEEFYALFDEAGRPKPGVRHRATRGIPLTQR